MQFVVCLGCVVPMLVITQSTYGMEYIADGQNPKASEQNIGNAEQPLKTIRKAGEMAHAVDSVIVKAGVTIK